MSAGPEPSRSRASGPRGGSWPRDRPVRWGSLANNLGRWFVGTAALIVQLALVVPLLVVTGSSAGDALGGFARIGLALAWGGLTLWAAWSWVVARWRVVLAPIATVATFWLAGFVFG